MGQSPLVRAAVVLTAVARHGVSSSSSDDVAFGPDGCVTLSRSDSGACVFDTDCTGKDLSDFEFAFDCEDPEGQPGDLVRHSFGLGGFDERETFESDVKCGKCALPSPPPKGLPPVDSAKPSTDSQQPPADSSGESPTHLRAATSTTTRPARPPVAHLRAAVSEAGQVAGVVAVVATGGVETLESKSGHVKAVQQHHKTGRRVHVSRYGPDNCVSTYPDKDGHCVMETNCKQESILNFDFSFFCEENDGSETQHVFGQGSFDAVEKFNTLLVCKRCLGSSAQDPPPKNIPAWESGPQLQQEVGLLTNTIRSLRSRMAELMTKVQQVTQTQAAAPQQPPPAPPVTPPAPPVATQPAAAPVGMQPGPPQGLQPMAPAAAPPALLSQKVIFVHETLRRHSSGRRGLRSHRHLRSKHVHVQLLEGDDQPTSAEEEDEAPQQAEPVHMQQPRDNAEDSGDGSDSAADAEPVQAQAILAADAGASSGAEGTDDSGEERQEDVQEEQQNQQEEQEEDAAGNKEQAAESMGDAEAAEEDAAPAESDA
eukprot:TRINITY_DN35717_c0_g1_i1.p1 TRINITY_DN35717_c0_g1~~TRINITY_DN35717_c0_g1_i1.p1  ORF type:complete len:539 (+),score=152.68 TRINITY_DN35717_c0_g1_i1:73-1689(+)